MTGIKTSVAVLALSAALTAPVLAQGVSVDTQTRSNAQGAVSPPGASGGAGAGVGAKVQAGAPGAKAGVKTQTDTTGTVGAGKGVQGSAGAAGKAEVGGKRTQP